MINCNWTDVESVLTDREITVARLAATKGITSKEIAEQLNITGRTADRHIHSILQKVKVYKIKNRTQLAIAYWKSQNSILKL